MYRGDDEEKGDFLWMEEWRVYCREDMVNWREDGCGLAIECFEWGDEGGWGGEWVEGEGKFYWYVCVD